MDQAIFLPLAAWQNFYVIVGSSAGALTGLQFVVLTLIAQAGAGASTREISAFGTPNVVHFCTALLISALMTAPWQASSHLAVCFGGGGILGVIYSIRIFWHARKATYNPDMEDWLWYSIFPFLANTGLIAAAVVLWLRLEWSLWAVAADTLAFLLIGIHNSWDTITYIVVQHANRSKKKPIRAGAE